MIAAKFWGQTPLPGNKQGGSLRGGFNVLKFGDNSITMTTLDV